MKAKDFLSPVHWKLAFSVSFCVRKADFSALVREKSTLRTQNDTDSANFRCTAIKKYHSYHVWNVFNRVSEPRLALALKYAFPHLVQIILKSDLLLSFLRKFTSVLIWNIDTLKNKICLIEYWICEFRMSSNFKKWTK